MHSTVSCNSGPGFEVLVCEQIPLVTSSVRNESIDRLVLNEYLSSVFEVFDFELVRVIGFFAAKHSKNLGVFAIKLRLLSVRKHKFCQNRNGSFQKE